MGRKNEQIGMSQAEFVKQFETASKKGSRRLVGLPKAARAQFEKTSKRMVLEMKNGVTLLVPVNLIQGLQNADENALSDFRITADGSQIHWDKLDVQFYIKDLLDGVFGTPMWMRSLREHLAEIGRKGGSSRSKQKVESSRKNGAKGGRPRKVAQ